MRKNKCTGCKCRFPADQLISINTGKFHTYTCAAEYGKAKADKARAKQIAKAKSDNKKQEKAERAKHRADKERVKKRSKWYDELQTLVNQYVVHVRDKGKPCCTCGTEKPDIKYDAGHMISRGAKAELRFELTNIHIQCSVNCNQHGAGKRAEYNEFCIAKYGQEHYDWLIGPHPTLKVQFPHYEDVKKEIARYRKLLRDNGIKPNI
jgi:hypothetical protein